MIRFWLFCLALLPLRLIASCDVLVSIPPTKFLVEKIAGGTLSVSTLVPPGLSPHDFEPNAKEMVEALGTKIWFQIGEGFERRSAKALPSGVPRVNLSWLLRSDLDKGHDNHIWLSPRLLKKQAVIIERELQAIFPEKSAIFAENCRQLLNALDLLEKEIKGVTDGAKRRTILVVHPAFGHFCKEYGFQQMAIEQEGKEPTAKHLIRCLAKAKEAQIEHIFTAPQYSLKEASVLAKELHATLVSIDPYREELFDNLREIATRFSQ